MITRHTSFPLLLAATGLAMLGAESPAAVPYVVQISLDGLGGIYLQSYVTAAPGEFPHFARLQTEGAFTYNARCDFGASETIPNHACMFTGRPSLQPEGFPATTHHGCINNSPGTSDTYHNSGNLSIPYKASVFDVVHDHGLSTALYAGKSKLAICDRSYDAVTGALDLVGEDNGRDKIDFAFVGDYAALYGTPFTNQVNALLTNLHSSVPKNFSFLHIAEPDGTGHTTGWNDAGGNYSNMVRRVDGQLGRILNAIDQNPTLSNQTAVIITTDHGGGGMVPLSHSEPEYRLNYTVPFFLWAPGIPAGADLYALFPNRADPGTNRTDYGWVPQPLRNGDSGNLALSLLGLPPIPDSLMRPMLAPHGIALTVNKLSSGVEISWPAAATALLLESSPILGPGASWEEISEGITITGARRVFAAEISGAGRFYRLRKP